MDTSMFHFEHEGKNVLGFDTGLSERTFAQAKAGFLITDSGYLISQQGSINIWRPEGVIEINKSMIIWGPDFEGTPLDILIQHNTDKDTILNAIRHWLRAVLILAEKNIFPDPSPGGAIIGNDGAVLFPSPALVKRTLDAAGEKKVLSASVRYLHPDLQGRDALTFCAGTMLYHLFSGEAPCQYSDHDAVRSSIRAGNFIPLDIAAPGLDEHTTRLINTILKHANDITGLTDIDETLGQEDSKQYCDFFRQISDDEKNSFISKREQYRKRNQTKTKTKSFFRKNRTVFMAAGIGIAAAILIVWNFAAGQNSRPSTKGMSPIEIAEQYYESFGTLNHEFMDAAAINDTGEDDREMVQNLFLLSKIRQAYEMIDPVVPAQRWIDAGSPDIDSMIFGVANLTLTEIDQTDDEALFEAKYALWIPSNFTDGGEPSTVPESAETQTNPMPVSFSYSSVLKLIKQNEVWRIAEIIKHQE